MDLKLWQQKVHEMTTRVANYWLQMRQCCGSPFANLTLCMSHTRYTVQAVQGLTGSPPLWDLLSVNALQSAFHRILPDAAAYDLLDSCHMACCMLHDTLLHSAWATANKQLVDSRGVEILEGLFSYFCNYQRAKICKTESLTSRVARWVGFM